MSDAGGALRLPVVAVAGTVLLERVTLVIEAGRIVRAFHPVFPPDRSTADLVE